MKLYMHRILPGVLILSALVFSGCQNYTQKTAQRDAIWRKGDLNATVAMVNKEAEENKDNRDTVLVYLEQGAVLRAAALAGMAPQANPQAASVQPQDFYLQSIRSLDFAEQRISDYDEKAKVSVSREAGALLTNQANLPYTGRAYDRVMMNTYKALSYMHEGNFDAARVELNRSLQRQRDAVADNAKRIEQAQEDALAAKQGKMKNDQGQSASYDVDKALADPKTRSGLDQIEADLNLHIYNAYGDYVNPFSVFLDGLYFLYQGADASDLERARVSLKRVAEMSPAADYILPDIAAAEAGRVPNNVVYVIFETGMAPSREQVKISIPTFIVTSKVSYIGAAFPRLNYFGDFVSSLTASDGKTEHKSVLLASMDSVVSRDFKNEWPSIVTKTIASAGVKAVIDASFQEAAKKKTTDKNKNKNKNNDSNEFARLMASLTTAIIQEAINIADTRTWRTLPKQFQYLRMEIPESRRITLDVGGRKQTIDLNPGSVQVVYVKSISTSAPLLISQFNLK